MLRIKYISRKLLPVMLAAVIFFSFFTSTAYADDVSEAWDTAIEVPLNQKTTIITPDSKPEYSDEYADYYGFYFTVTTYGYVSVILNNSVDEKAAAYLLDATNGYYDVINCVSGAGASKEVFCNKGKYLMWLYKGKTPSTIDVTVLIASSKGGTKNVIPTEPEIKTGWQSDAGSWYYYNSDGSKATGWNKIEGKWYYMNSDGIMQTGWKKISGKWYYFGGGGKMNTGWKRISGKWYYFGPNGSMRKGWKKISDKWYYFKGSGEMQTGKVTIGGVLYTFSADGVWIE